MWNFFGFKPDDHRRGVIQCNQCFSAVAAPQGNETDLYNRLRRHHKVQLELSVQGQPLFCCLLKASKCLRCSFSKCATDHHSCFGKNGADLVPQSHFVEEIWKHQSHFEENLLEEWKLDIFSEMADNTRDNASRNQRAFKDLHALHIFCTVQPSQNSICIRYINKALVPAHQKTDRPLSSQNMNSYMANLLVGIHHMTCSKGFWSSSRLCVQCWQRTQRNGT